MRTLMMAITTKSSISVKPPPREFVLGRATVVPPKKASHRRENQPSNVSKDEGKNKADFQISTTIIGWLTSGQVSMMMAERLPNAAGRG
jgi:hypothetical protein